MSKDNEIYITGDVVYTEPKLTKIPGIRLSMGSAGQWRNLYFLSFGLLDGTDMHKQLTYSELLTLRDAVNYLLKKDHQIEADIETLVKDVEVRIDAMGDLDDAKNTRTN